MVKLDTARVVHWINKGAQPTDTVRSILKKEGIMLRMHLMRWGKTEEEIETAVAEFQNSTCRQNRQVCGQFLFYSGA